MEARRRITLYDQMTATNTTTTTSRDSLASLMLDDVVFKKTQAQAQAQAQASRSRTLQDIIREEETNHGAKDRNSWKAFKEKLRLKRALGSAWSSSAANTNNDDDDDEDDSNNINGNGNGNGDGDGDGNLPAQSEAQNDVVVGVSLMDLLEETTEQEMELCRASDEDEDYVDDDDDDGGGGDDVEECKYKKGEAEEEGKEGLVEYKCCVCMVRHKGAAFIPCGHTFCRTCSREVWVTRGNCPLCNNLILEILDIF